MLRRWHTVCNTVQLLTGSRYKLQVQTSRIRVANVNCSVVETVNKKLFLNKVMFINYFSFFNFCPSSYQPWLFYTISYIVVYVYGSLNLNLSPPNSTLYCKWFSTTSAYTHNALPWTASEPDWNALISTCFNGVWMTHRTVSVENHKLHTTSSITVPYLGLRKK